MNIKLDLINSLIENEIIIKEKVEIPKDYFINTEIIDLTDITFDGKIFKDVSDELILKGTIKGTMILEDSISLNEIKYKFTSNIEENLENVENSIDIIPILWQNIVLEVPLKVTEVKDFGDYCGDGWKLISEEEDVKNNPFQELKEIFKEEW